MLAVAILLKVYMQQDISSRQGILLWLHYRINNGNGVIFISNILDNSPNIMTPQTIAESSVTGIDEDLCKRPDPI
jgi:hypothetical protein